LSTLSVGALGLGGAALGGAALWAFDSAPYPYAQRRLLDIPLPYLGQRRLEQVLQPRPGERLLELGPGTGLQSVPTAAALGESGRLDVVDIQQEMLDHVGRRAAGAGVTNVVATCASGQELPFPDGSFDAAYTVTALGEMPEPREAFAELARVVKPGGRVVVGEFFDRHQVPKNRLVEFADGAGLRLERMTGPWFAYYALLRKTAA
jgi:ubiquinone/menaquinone biosynthesis C-methylase UbiE